MKKLRTISIIQEDDETPDAAIHRLDGEANRFLAAEDDEGYMCKNGDAYSLNGGLTIGTVGGKSVLAYTFVKKHRT